MTDKIKTTLINSKKKSEGKKVLISSSETFYDDCPICQAMKKAEEEGRSLSEAEAKEAFAKANRKQKQGEELVQ